MWQEKRWPQKGWKEEIMGYYDNFDYEPSFWWGTFPHLAALIIVVLLAVLASVAAYYYF